MMDLCFLDTETTGPAFGFHEIIDIAAIRTPPDGGLVRDAWQRRIRPRHPDRITDFARRHIGFKESEWEAESPSSPELWRSFSEFAAGAIPICHNPAFDRAFVELEASRQGVPELELDYHWIGTETLAWVLFRRREVERINLHKVAEALGLDPEPTPHTAMGGAQSCRAVYLELMRRLGAEESEPCSDL